MGCRPRCPWFLALCTILLVSGAVLGQEVKYNYAQGTGFSKYKTYRWVELEGTMHPDQLVEQQIIQAIDAQLASKGLARTDAEDADLLVGYQVSVHEEKEWTS